MPNSEQIFFSNENRNVNKKRLKFLYKKVLEILYQTFNFSMMQNLLVQQDNSENRKRRNFKKFVLLKSSIQRSIYTLDFEYIASNILSSH